MATEQLIGGPCDGLTVETTPHPIMYAGRVGSPLVNVYRREARGLVFVHSYGPGEEIAPEHRQHTDEPGWVTEVEP